MTRFLPLLSAATLALLLSSGARAQLGTFPCDAFQMQSNGMLAVVKPVSIQSANGSDSMGPGMSFGPGVTMMGLNVYGLYQQYCR